MSAAVVEPAAPPDPIAVYRDDGPLAHALSRAGRAVPLSAPLLALAALLPLVVAVVVAGDDGSDTLAGVVVAWVLLAGGAATGAGGPRKAVWAVTPLIRLSEYLALIWIAALHGESAYPAVYALLAALAFRHYDLVYRLRHRGVQPAPWVSALALGWDGRLVLAFLLLAAGALPTGYFVVAGVLGAAFVGEAVYGWVVVGRIEQPLDDEEDDEL
jgi:hypothetical protein